MVVFVLECAGEQPFACFGEAVAVHVGCGDSTPCAAFDLAPDAGQRQAALLDGDEPPRRLNLRVDIDLGAFSGAVRLTTKMPQIHARLRSARPTPLASTMMSIILSASRRMLSSISRSAGPFRPAPAVGTS